MSTPKLFDVHTHVQFAAFKDDADLVTQRALDAGIWIINIGTQRDTSENAVALAYRFTEGVYATAGLHPVHTEKSYHDEKELGASEEAKGFTSRGEDFDYEYYKKLVQDSKVVAIGECGLDYYRLESETKNKQERAFIQQIELAHETKKPLMIHCRSAFPDLINILVSCRMSLVTRPGVVHFFSGTKDDAQKLLDLGFSFTFGGVITFGRDYDEVIKYIPLERLMIETDAPYVAPVPYRGKRNEPVYVIEVAKKLAEIIKRSPDDVVFQTTVNTRALFRI